MWHEARRSERKVHDLMDAARRRAQRRAVFLAKRRGDPHQSLQVVGTRCRMYRDDGLYQAAEDQQGLIPWNGKQDIMIDRFDGRALLDFIRDTHHLRPQEKTEEEEELEEFVNFERYRDLIKHRHRGFSDEEGLKHVSEELEAKFFAPFVSERPHSAQPPTKKGSYSQVGFSYDDDRKGDSHLLESDEDNYDGGDGGDGDDDEKDSSGDESNDERMNVIAKDFGIKRFSWLMHMDKKAKEEEKHQKEVIKGDPYIRKLSRKERRKVSQMEREREREAARITGSRLLHHDPYREPRRSPSYEAYSRSRRSKSRSRSPSYSRRSDCTAHADHGQRGRAKVAKVEYITEFSGSPIRSDQMLGVSPPPSPPPSLSDVQSRPSTSHILEALHVDPASGVTLDQERSTRPVVKTTVSTTSAIAKLSKSSTSMGGLKPLSNEKKETPQERLKRIMSKQLNKQIKKDSAVELAKKREQERQRQEKLAEMSRISRSRRRSDSRSRSRSPPRRYRRSRSRSWCRSRSRSQSRSHSRSRNSSRSRSPRRYHSRSRSPRARGPSRY